AQFLGRGWIDSEAVGIVSVALRLTHLFRVAIPPDGAFPQQPVRCEPGASEHQRRPPGVRSEDDRRCNATYHLNQTRGDEAHGEAQGRAADAEIEVSSHAEISGESGILEM